DEHETELAEHRAPAPIPLGEAVARDRKLQRALFDAGWSRWGWPEHVGGLGGTAVLRAAMYEQLCASGYHIPECFFIIETVGPMMVEFGPELAEVFYDDAAVPKDRLIGEVNTGWQLAMYLLQWERGMYAWQRQAYMHSTLQEALARSAGTRPADAAARVGDAYNLMFALRAR